MRRLGTGLLFITLAISACIKDDHFGKSGLSQIKAFEIPGQVTTTTIDHEALTVTVPMPENLIDFNLVPSVITVSNFASVTPGVGVQQDFTDPVPYTVTAENGAVSVYMVSVERTGAQIQLPNSSFEDWFTASAAGKQFEQPGVDAATTIWGTANRGLALGGADANTTPQQKGVDSTFVRMESVAAPAIVRMAAATIFTGKFTTGFPSISDPRSNIELGTPYGGRPLNVSFAYKYQPGSSNEDENGTPLAYGDQCDVYVLFENRDGSKPKRVATAWFRSGDAVTNWTRVSIPVKYGPLDATDPWYDYAQPRPDEEWGDGGETVTHISFLATSSFEGDFFKGAIGSTLDLDNLVLGY